MNLIEIAEQLKDVPDQYLMQEVQQPTGNYPSYLVISELGRRKRMRDSVMKQMPETTVAEDLAQPERQQAMAQMGQMPQDQNMIQQAGGLNALPQAQQDLAALDMMSAQPQEIPAMAGGGMVSFSNGGMPEERFQYIPRSSLDPYIAPGTPLPNTVGALRRFGETFPTTGRLFGMDEDRLYIDPVTKEPITYQEFLSKYPQSAAETRRLQRGPRALSPAAVAPAAGQPARQPAGQAGQANVQPQAVPQAAPQVAPGVFTLPTDTERTAAAKAGLELYDQAMPDRLATFRTDLEKLQKEAEGRKGSNINEALIQAGLGIMGSRAPSALQAIAEGGMGGLRGYREGMKDIRDSQNALRQSQLEMAKAEMLRDQGKYKAAQDAEDRAINLRVKGAELAKLGSDIEARNRLLPAQIAALEGQAEAYRTRGSKLQVADQMLVISTRKQALDALGITQNEYNSDRAKRAAVDQAVAQALEEKGFAYPNVNIAPRTIDFQVQ